MAFLKAPKFQKPQFDFHLPRKFGGGNGNAALDAAEEQRHQELERLFTSTRAGKHFQKDFVKGVESIISTGNKQLEVLSKLAEDCKKYSSEGPSIPETLKRATRQYGSARGLMEKERENFHRSLTKDVSEPLKAMANGSPLEDARQLKQKYDRLRQDADYQASEVNRRKTKDPGSNPDFVAKLQAAEQKLDDITSAMGTMGQSATSAMSEVESRQHITSLKKILAMVDAERAYFLRVTSILDSLHSEIESEVQKSSMAGSRDSFHGAEVPKSSMTGSYNSFHGAEVPKSSMAGSYNSFHGVEVPKSSMAGSYNSFHGVEVPKSSMAGSRTSSHGADLQKSSISGSRNPSRGATPPQTPPASPFPAARQMSVDPPESSHHTSNGSSDYEDSLGGYPETDGDKIQSPTETKSFYATAVDDFEGQDDDELTICVGDEVLVDLTTSSGWSQGHCNGQSGWFPSSYVRKRPLVRRARGKPGRMHGSR